MTGTWVVVRETKGWKGRSGREQMKDRKRKANRIPYILSLKAKMLMLLKKCHKRKVTTHILIIGSSSRLPYGSFRKSA
jgi:hypothetical protein